MDTAVACKQCGFQFEIDLQFGGVASLRLDQHKMNMKCKKVSEPGFAYDCANLTSALLTTIEHQTNLQHRKWRLEMRRALSPFAPSASTTTRVEALEKRIVQSRGGSPASRP
jgi:hypothetical protein